MEIGVPEPSFKHELGGHHASGHEQYEMEELRLRCMLWVTCARVGVPAILMAMFARGMANGSTTREGGYDTIERLEIENANSPHDEAVLALLRKIHVPERELIGDSASTATFPMGSR